MSKLVDLLNPAPANAAGSTGSTGRPTVSTSTPPVHRRNESLSSPLETLTIAAAAANAPATQPRAAYTSSFPPNPYLNTNPYAIKPQTTQPNRPPTNTQTSSASSTNMENVKPPTKSSPPPPADMERIASPPQNSQGSTPAVVKKESPDEQVTMTNKTVDTPTVKLENNKQVVAGQEIDGEMKGATPPDAKVVKEHKKSTAATKKGTAKAKKDVGDSSSSAARKAPMKKRKLEPESKDGTPFSQRSGTPNSRTSKTPAQKRTPQQSPGPQASDNADEDYEAASGDEDGEVYCICRRGDDHTWMIGCDGGCEDWFHGHCVHIDKADGPLIDKYICPNCEAAGRGRTMWKPMCRLPGCREPARVAGKKPSKYCSDEHGIQFMRDKALGRSGKGNKHDEARKRRKANRTDNAGNEGDEAALLNGDDSDDGHQAHLRGGVLKPGELKALVSGVKTVDEFKRLGDRATIAPTTDAKTVNKDASGDVAMEDADGSNADLDPDVATPKLILTKQEQAALDVSSKQRSKLNSQLSMLADRDKLLAMVKTRHKSVVEELRKRDKTVKDVCGYDTRLMWSEEEFNSWRASEEGKSILASNVLPPPARRAVEATNGNGAAEDEEEVGRGVCKRKRCERHKTWAKLEQQEINLARSQCWHQMRKLDRDEEELKDRALMRQREAR